MVTCPNPSLPSHRPAQTVSPYPPASHHVSHHLWQLRDNLRCPPAHQQQTRASRNAHRQTRFAPNQTPADPSPLPHHHAPAAHRNPSRQHLPSAHKPSV